MNLDDLRARLFVTVPEAAAGVFGVDERTLRRAIADGQVPGVRIGAKTLIPVPALLRLLGAAGSGEGQPGDDAAVAVRARAHLREMPGGGGAA